MKIWMSMTLAGLFAVLIGCSEQPVATDSGDATATDASQVEYVTTTEPEGAVPVGEARENAKDEQAITLVGVIGGSTEPFVDGLAAFTIVDPKVPYCATEEGCPTPWDYCCTQDQVKDNIATVKVVDEQGNPVASDARTLLNVKPLSTVVVRGQAQRDDAGNLSVLADQVFVKS